MIVLNISLTIRNLIKFAVQLVPHINDTLSPKVKNKLTDTVVSKNGYPKNRYFRQYYTSANLICNFYKINCLA